MMNIIFDSPDERHHLDPTALYRLAATEFMPIHQKAFP